MNGNGHDNGPRIPISGAAGASIFAVLQSLATLHGEGEVTIAKRRAAGGGYVYVIHKTQPPAPPVTTQ